MWMMGALIFGSIVLIFCCFVQDTNTVLAIVMNAKTLNAINLIFFIILNNLTYSLSNGGFSVLAPRVNQRIAFIITAF